ncbi:phage tail tip fiber protein [Providencia manganoxydans]|uniref:phage tail tip fiber protein n=1 Tax=Providencia manganoxydans TaxID=2923283 RepID=UPI0034DDA865
MKKGIIAGAGGGGSKGGSSRTPVEAVDNVESKSLAYILDLLGEGVIGGLKEGAKSVFLDDVPLANPDGSLNFNGVKIWERKGEQNQDPIEGFDDIETPRNVAVEVKATTPKTIQIDNDECDQVRIIMDFPRLSSTDKASGDINGATVEFQFQLAVGDGGFKPVIPVDHKSDIIKVSKKSSGKFQKEYFISLPKPGKNYRIKVVRLTADSTSDYLANKTILSSYGEIIFAKLSYPNSALVGIAIDSKEFGGNMPRRSYLVSGMYIRVPSNYDPVDNEYKGDWDGTFEYRISSNPAWILFDILVSDRYGLGEYVKEYMIDTGMLYQIGRYCDEEVSDGFGGKEKRFAINTVISSRQEAFKVINDIASVFRGMVFWAGGMINMRQDKPSDPVMLFSSANIIGRVTRKGSARKDRPTVAVVTYNDKDDLYKQNIEYVEDQDAIKDRGVVKTELLAFGCTSRGQAHRTGLWLLYTAKMETDVILFKAGIDCSALMPGDVVKLNDKYRSGKRNSGRIVSFTKNSIKLDQSVNLSNSGAFISFMSKEGKLIDRDVLEAAGERSVLTFKEPLKAHEEPVNLAVWMVTEPDLEPELVRVVSIKDTDEKGVFEITGVSHNPSKYQAIDNGATLIPSKTTVKDPTFVTPSNIKINETTYLSSPGNLSNKLIVSWQGRSTQYTIRYRRSDVVDNWAVVEVFDTQYEILNVQQDAKYDVEVFAISITGRKTNAIASTYAVLGKSNPPDAPKQLVAVGDYRQNVLTWIAPAAIDLEKINVYGSKTNKFETASLLASVPSTTFNHSGLEDNVTWFYWVRAVNKRGMLSPVNSNIGTQATTKEVMSFLKDKITETELSKDLLADINENAANLAAEKVNEDVKIQVDEVKKNVAESKDMANKAISDITKLSTSVDKEIADRKESVTALTNSTNSLSEKLTQEIKNRNDSVAAESQKRADDLVAESKSRVADIKKETDARLLGLQNEAKARSNALKEETRLRNEAIQTKSAELSKEILNEKVERGAAISASERKIQTKTDALAMRITNLSTATDANAAAIKKEEQARTTADKAEAKERQSLATQMRGDYDGTDVTKITSGLIFSEREARTTADKAEALQRRTLETRLGESLTAVNKSVESISTAQKAQGNDITAINTTLKNKADSSAVNSLNSKVEEQGKTLTSQGSAVTKLQNDLGVANTSIGKKADSSALSALESKVVQQGKDIVSQGSLVNSLQNNLNTTNANVNKKADSSTVSTLDSKVTQQGKDIASQGGLLNTLQNRINTTDSNVSKKADSSAVTALESKVTQQSKDLTSTSGNLVKLSNTVNNMTVGGTNLISVADSEIGTVREATNIGAVYNDVKYPAKNRVRNKTLINATKGIVVSIDKGYQFFVCSYDANSKYLGAARSFTWRQNDLIIPAFSGFISVVITKSDNSDITLNEVIKSRVKVEIGNVRTDWSMSPLDTASANDISNLQSANSEALSSLNNKVDKQGKDITAVSSQINSLKNSLNETNTNVSKKADSTALSSLDSKVVQQGKDISTISTNVTTLQNNLKMTNDNVSKKADSSALSTLDSKVVQQGKDITSSASEIATLKNNLKTTDANVSKKAESSALSALDNKVTQQGKDISSHGNSITELKNSTSAIKNDLDDVNLLARITTNGKQLVSNPNFNGGSNDVVVYNNANNGMALIATTKRQVDNPTSSSHEIVLTAKGTASPNFGGFIRNVQSKANAVFVTKYIIKLPVGWGLQAHANATGDGRIDKFVGNNTGTGKYETYYRITKCGSTGKFETFGHVSVYIADGGKTKAPTSAAPLVWYLAQIEVYETTDYASATPEVTNFMSSAKSSLDSLTNTTKSQSSQLTALQNSLNTTNSNVGKKADSSALSALDSKVTQQGKDITATNNSVTSLQSSLNGRITFVITSGGTGSGYSGRVFDNNGKVLASIGRSYGVVVFKKNTKGMVDVASSKTYDVYGNAANATTLVNDIKALPYGTYVAITTSDEPNQNRLSILAAIELLGGTKETFTSFPHRGAYILVGRIGARGGDSIELASRSGNDSNAFVETSIEFVNGVLMNYGNSSGAASLASANASAISKLDNTVKQQGGNITSHSSQLTKLQNDLNITNNNVGKKADATALSALESKVTQQGKDISSVSSKATSLENSLKTTNDNVGKKADTTALNSLTSKVNTVEGKVNAATSSITTLSSKIDQVKSDLTDLIEVDLDLSKLDQNTYYPVTLHLNTLTRYYFKVFRTLGQFPTNKPSYATHGTKTFSTILEWNVSGDGWGTQAQNRIIQNFDFRFTNQSPVLTPGQLSNSSIEYVYLRGGSFYKLTKPKNCGHTIRTAAYTSNSQAVAPIAYNASLIPVSFGKGTSDAISNLSTKVTSIDGKLNTTASDVTNLKTTVGKKADSTALNSLTSTVTQHGKDISAHSSSLSQLTTKVNGNTTKIDQVSKSVSDVSKAQTETKNSMESQFKGQSAKIETLEKTVASGAGLSSTWMVKMAANAKGQKYAAGIALGIEGKNLQSQFLVQADRFALINTANGTTTTPFVIDGGVTYISAASIKNGSIDSAKFGDLQSNNYAAGKTGWKLSKNGVLEMNGQTSGQGRLSITNNRIDVYDEKGVLRVRLGLL